jgi:hypothetical protein
MKKLFIVALAATFSFTSIGCFGSFNLTKKLYTAHKGLGDKWINWVVFVVGGEAVYGLTIFADVIVLNSIEYWTGSNPVASNTLEQTDESGNKLIATRIPGGALELTVIKADGTIHSTTLTKNEDTFQAFDENGKLVAQYSAPVEVSQQ